MARGWIAIASLSDKAIFKPTNTGYLQSASNTRLFLSKVLLSRYCLLDTTVPIEVPHKTTLCCTRSYRAVLEAAAWKTGRPPKRILSAYPLTLQSRAVQRVSKLNVFRATTCITMKPALSAELAYRPDAQLFATRQSCPETHRCSALHAIHQRCNKIGTNNRKLLNPRLRPSAQDKWDRSSHAVVTGGLGLRVALGLAALGLSLKGSRLRIATDWN